MNGVTVKVTPFFYAIGNSYGIPYYIKNIIALRRRSSMSLRRPAVGGESCVAGFYFPGIYFTNF